jgi:lactate permease
VVAVGRFGFGGTDDEFDLAAGVTGVLAEAAFISLTVIAIIGPALGIHQLQQRTGATEVLREALGQLTPDPRVAALLIAWFFALFIEGAAGFGTPIALAAPFLVAAGFQPVTAVAAALVGHAAGVSFGAVGTPVAAQAAISSLSGAELAAATAPYHVAAGWFLALMVVITIGRGIEGASIPWAWGVLAAVSFFLPFGLIGIHLGPELPTLGGAVAGAAVFISAVILVQRRSDGPPPGFDSPSRPDVGRNGETKQEGRGRSDRSMSTIAAGAPYVALILLVLVTRMIPVVREPLESVRLSWTFAGEFSGSVQPLFHPAVLLTLSFLIGAWVQRPDSDQVTGAFVVATRQLAGVVVALIAMVTIARTMSQAGMTDELAAAATASGAAWPLVAPMIGALGTFVTGSATSSNILFTELQEETAVSAGFAVPPLLGAQGFGAAVGNIICPHNIVAAAGTVGLAGQEGVILRRTLPVALVYVALGGALALWWTR